MEEKEERENVSLIFLFTWIKNQILTRPLKLLELYIQSI